jgi:hypothetical protein
VGTTVSLTPRIKEVSAIVAVLEREDHETPQALAKEILKLCAELLAQRESIVVGIGLQSDDLYIPHGPFWSLGDAKRVIKAASERGFKSDLRNVWPSDDAVPERVTERVTCADCGHVKSMHASFGCAVMSRVPKAVCPCSGFKR